MKAKRFVSLFLALVMALSLAVPAFASDPVREPATVPCDEPYDEERIFDPTQADFIDIIEESHTRGANKPTEFFNLDGATYAVDGTFDTSIYTSYYFYPNAQGKLFYNMKFEWQVNGTTGFAVERGVRVECWDRTDNKMVTDTSFGMKLQADGSYSLVIETDERVVYNLNPTHQYYFRFSKAHDGYNATVKGTIHT